MNKKSTRKNFFIVFLIFALLVLAILIYRQVMGYPNQEPQVENIDLISNEKKENVDVQTIDSKYPNLHLHLEMIDVSTKDYKYSIMVPTLTGETTQETIHTYLKEEKEIFIQEHEKNTPADQEGYLNIRMETQPITDTIYNLVFHRYKLTGGANGATNSKVFVIDTEKDKLLTFDDFFIQNESSLLALEDMLKESYYNTLDEGFEGTLDEEALKQLVSDPSRLKWAFTQEHVTFYFDEYEVTAGSEGLIQIQLPLSSIYFMMTDFAKELLQMEPAVDEALEPVEPVESKPLDPNGKYVALTFDDGPNPKSTPRVLDILKKHQVHATFFTIGNLVDYYPDIVKRTALEGHEMGNHTWNHFDLTRLDQSSIEQEIDQSNEAIKKIIGRYPSVFRPPYGAYNDTVLQITAARDQPMILWSVDTRDWEHRNPDKIHEIVMKQVHDGAIILMHDCHETTADGLERVVVSLKEAGYQFVTVSQLLEHYEMEGYGPHFGHNRQW